MSGFYKVVDEFSIALDKMVDVFSLLAERLIDIDGWTSMILEVMSEKLGERVIDSFERVIKDYRKEGNRF